MTSNSSTLPFDTTMMQNMLGLVQTAKCTVGDDGGDRYHTLDSETDHDTCISLSTYHTAAVSESHLVIYVALTILTRSVCQARLLSFFGKSGMITELSPTDGRAQRTGGSYTFMARRTLVYTSTSQCILSNNTEKDRYLS